ncbi:putative 3-beta hydroxysteroid dehydrogenase/isomerase [Hypoxylon rubiginosum]|uniref:3-beta hydroxysteroid dehydrogenase/isomerase n=1 Tax=Hypoxylon rubiginosum TaxID=110542 RepID=A0ACC0CNE1_9PEZI|nr:putative 3-beta hydroxysteroid dehydrogenase/isomerase [Hypoxylon rubiginosum]
MSTELVLITGVSGFLGYATTVSALESGYRVRGVVRRELQINEIKRVLPGQFLDKIEFVIIPDLGAVGAFGEPMKDVDHIIHVASPVPADTDEYTRDYLEPARDITLNVFSAAVKFPQIKRIVVTSSIAPFIPTSEFASGNFSKDVFRSDDEICHYKMTDQFPNRVFAYLASKSIALDAGEQFIKDNKPPFGVVFLMPTFVFGPNKLSRTVEELTKGSNHYLLDLILGKLKDPSLTVSVHIDDVAKLHVLSLDSSIPPGRYLLDSEGASGTNWSEALPFVRKYFQESIGKVFVEEVEAHPVDIRIDNSKAEETFGIKFKSFEEQVKDTVGFYLSLISD